ncbi:putative precorrin-6A synthase [Mycobacterium kansasii]|uniref:Putative precorrin-6A synthase n=1 Tax=Mycobacterium kansasii TaxID=1768 RepID=A0A1V3XJ20_MYCKA|nr:putative precorrin-6A synthase [Mycobacterium kansasii]
MTARHRIPLNDVGAPVLITTGRQLRARGLTGSAVVMLDAECSFQSCPPQTRIWWGAYLGTADELLMAGTVGEVGRASRHCAPRPGRGMAGSWIPTCCERQIKHSMSFLTVCQEACD